MALTHELIDDLKYIYECFSSNPRSEFKFSGTKGPIVALHGVVGGWTKNGLRRYMESNNVGGILNYFGGMEDGLDKYVEGARQLIDNYPNALVLGFSAGGIIALKYAEKYGWDNFYKIMTVASPLFGSPPASFLKYRGETYNQLSPGSQYLAEIVNIRPPKGKVLSIFSEWDLKAPFNNEKTLNWPVTVVNSKSHGQIQNDYRTIENLINKEF